MMKDQKSIQTYGEKPTPFLFKFEENSLEESYYIGSEIGNYLRLFRGTLYKKYPSLWRRAITQEERRRLIQMGLSKNFCLNLKK
jgi:SWI/SNF-related matrix-associated actin-dependent regulator of chromatin subfamily B protein 1